MIPTFAKAGWIFFLRTAARSSGFFPLWRRDAKTKFPGSSIQQRSSDVRFSRHDCWHTLVGRQFQTHLDHCAQAPADGSYSILTIRDLNPALLNGLERRLALAVEREIRI